MYTKLILAFVFSFLIAVIPCPKERIKAEDLLKLKKISDNTFYLVVNGERAIKIVIKRRLGKEISPKKWNFPKNFDPAIEYQETIFKVINGWELSNYRFRDSEDEESFTKGKLLLTIRGIKKYAFMHRRDNSSFHILSITYGCFPIRVLIENGEKIEKKYSLNIYIGDTGENDKVKIEEDTSFEGEILY